MGVRLGVLVLGVASLLVGAFFTCQIWRYQKLAEGIVWLDDRKFESATLIAVGTGGAHENPHRLGPATAIGAGARVVLVDAGRGVAEALRHCSIPVAQPDTVLLTSLLPENTVGLDDLLFAGWNTPRTKPLRLVGPAGTRAYAEALAAAYAASVDALSAARGVARDGAQLDVVEIGDGWNDAEGGLAIRAAAVGDAPLPSLAYRFEANGRALVVSGVNPDPDRLAPFAAGAALLAGEGFLGESVQLAIDAGAPDVERRKREGALHAPLQKLGAIAATAGVPMLLVTRLEPPPLFDAQYETAVKTTYHGRTIIAGECAEITP